MALELTREQQKAVDAAGGEPVRVVDPRTRQAFVLVPADRCETVPRTPDAAGFPAASQLPREVPPGIQRSKEAFLRDLPSLLRQKRRRGQWVAYHGDKRLGFASTETELYQKCFRKGLKQVEFYVGWIGPYQPEPEQVDPSFFEFIDIPDGAPQT